MKMSRSAASELTPLLKPSDNVHLPVSSPSHSSVSSISLPAQLPRWFALATLLSVLLTLLWLVLLALGPQLALQMDVTFYLYAGVLNSLMGSFLSASGYCCQKYAHVRVARNAALGTAPMQTIFQAGVFLLAMGTVSAISNLGILGQAVQAPFAALTLIYSALLGRFVLYESFGRYDLLSSALTILGVSVDVYAAQLAHVAHKSYTLQSLGQLLTRNSVWPLGYTIVTLTYAMVLLRRVQSEKLQRHSSGLLAFSSCAGIMAGFTSLATKSVVEVTKSALKRHEWLVFVNPCFALLVIAIPCALVPQLFFLNKGLEFFGTLKFIPLYQAFIILGNMGCGMVFYNEMASYSSTALTWFMGGIVSTICGVGVLLVKVNDELAGADVRRLNAVRAVDQPTDELLDCKDNIKARFDTDFTFEQMVWATDCGNLTSNNLRVCRDFRECQEAIVELLVSARKSIYYSTFLCDFNQVLHTTSDEHKGSTFVSLVRDAVKRGVDVHVLYNPVRDYGTNSIADLRRILPQEVHVACSVSDLGPSWFTRHLSNNSRYAFHHQKYICADEETIMVTGCDVNTEREGWLLKNHLGYYWHELSVISRCTPEMLHWIRANHKPSQEKRYYDHFMESPPFPLVSGGWREENCMVNMIMNAKHSVQLESQIMISGGSLQHNRICPAIVARISQARRKGEPFHALILTNAAQKDEPSFLARTYCSLSIQWSLEQLEESALAYGLALDELWQHLQVGSLEYDNVLVKVHSNILIVDGNYALRSSSNLADRSLSARPNDTELGLLFSGPRVNELQQDLLNMYLGTVGESYSWSQVFERIRGSATKEPAGLIQPLKKKAYSPIFTWFLMNLFIYCSEGATGGRVKVTYETKVLGDNKHELET